MENTHNNDLMSILASSTDEWRRDAALKQLRKNVAELEHRNKVNETVIESLENQLIEEMNKFDIG